jgi:hypothetical protein
MLLIYLFFEFNKLIMFKIMKINHLHSLKFNKSFFSIKFTKIPTQINNTKANNMKVNDKKEISPLQKFNLVHQTSTNNPKLLNNLTIENLFLHLDNHSSSVSIDELFQIFSILADKLELDSNNNISNFQGFNKLKNLTLEYVSLKEKLTIEQLGVILHISYVIPEILNNDSVKLFSLSMSSLKKFDAEFQSLNLYKRLNFISLLITQINIDINKYIDDNITQDFDKLDFLIIFKFLNRLKNSKSSQSTKFVFFNHFIEQFVILTLCEDTPNLVKSYSLLNWISNNIYLSNYDEDINKLYEIITKADLDIESCFIFTENLKYLEVNEMNKNILKNSYEKIYKAIESNAEIDPISFIKLFHHLAKGGKKAFYPTDKQLELFYKHYRIALKDCSKGYILAVCVIMENSSVYDKELIKDLVHKLAEEINSYKVIPNYLKFFKQVVILKLGPEYLSPILNGLKTGDNSKLMKQIHQSALLSFFDPIDGHNISLESPKLKENYFSLIMTLLKMNLIYIQDIANETFLKSINDFLFKAVNEDFIDKCDHYSTIFRLFIEICSLKTYTLDEERMLTNTVSYIVCNKIKNSHKFFQKLKISLESDVIIKERFINRFVDLVIPFLYNEKSKIKKYEAEEFILCIFYILSKVPKEVNKTQLQNLLDKYLEQNIILTELNILSILKIYKSFKENSLHCEVLKNTMIQKLNTGDQNIKKLMSEYKDILACIPFSFKTNSYLTNYFNILKNK